MGRHNDAAPQAAHVHECVQRGVDVGADFVESAAFVGPEVPGDGVNEESEDDAEKFIRETQDRGGILACKIDASFLARRAFDWRRVRSRLAIWSQICGVR